MHNHKIPPPSLFFIFGGSGDLNQRKLSPALYNLFIDGWMPEKFGIVGIGRTPFTNEQFRNHLLNGIYQFSRRKRRTKRQMAGVFQTYQLPATRRGKMKANTSRLQIS